MPKHTPGPWRYRRDANPGEILTEDFEVIATILDPADEHARPTETDVANAYLLAAAPRMLAELRRDLVFAKHVLAFLSAGRETGEVLYTSAQGRVERIRAAIARAEGR